MKKSGPKYNDLDPILNNQIRLTVISILVKMKQADFNYLKERTNANQGNLSHQLKKLSEADYITIQKSFYNNYPKTTCKLTQTGLKAFETYVENIKNYLYLK
ncbi:MAG: transcriptional regulator [Chitinophagales bacterium]|nr:transcriptional regulator [Chitinophagales bacterium]